MGLMRWLADRFPNSPLHHVSSLTIDGRGVHCRRVTGDREVVPWDHIVRVLIRTTDRGPFDDDVFFVLETAAGAVVVPQDANGCDELLCALQGLPGFDNEAVIAAMGCTENREFLCLRRAAAD